MDNAVGPQPVMNLEDREVCVTGLGVTGPPTARVLAARGARVTVVDAADDDERRARAAELESLGVKVILGQVPDSPPPGTDLVVTSPGWRPATPLLAAARAAGVPVIGDVELAWQLRPAFAGGRRQEWLAVTGTNGKTTTVRMLASMLAAAGHRVMAAGNVGTALTDVVTDPHPYPVLAVELSSFQLHWSATVRPHSAVVLNVAPDHLDWHGSMEAYARDKGRIFAAGTVAVCNADDAWSARLAAEAAGDRAVAFTLGPPGPRQLGVARDTLVDRAFCEDGKQAELAAVSDVQPAAPHNVANALAAAALARSYGAPAGAVRRGLRAFQPERHRISLVGSVGGVDYVDDSKATNPHAAAASLAAYPSVVWVAGGLLKGAEVDDLISGAAGRLRAAVLLGTDRAKIGQALARHAPNVPVVEVSGTDTGVMDLVVTECAAFARPGDTVLLAPAAASLDMFKNYGERGDAFAAAVHRLAAAG
ncbi:MAG: UDP-N-acetylmuramoyl-L-alanine--D-glutamate ligase [Micromonosporaceae bacterium]